MRLRGATVRGSWLLRSLLTGGSAVLLAVMLSSCGSSPASSAGGSPGSTGSTITTATTGSGHDAGRGAVNLNVTGAVRAQLVAAGAGLHHLPISDYLGLVAGETYYAKDRVTGDYWAGAGLRPTPQSYEAGVVNQDDGAYMIFTRSPGGHWRGWETGVTGGTSHHCSVTVPAAVLSVWGWAPESCDPPAGTEPPSTGSTDASSGACTSTEISAQLVGTPSTQSQYGLVLELANVGSSTCTMDGFPGFELVGPLSNGTTTYEPVHQVTGYSIVTLVPGASAHADLWALPGPDTCDAGQAWVPASASVTLPGGSRPISVAWPGGSVDNCQGGATHPGTYVGPVVTGPTGP